MNTSWSTGPFQRVENRAGLVLGEQLSGPQGQCKQVCVLDSHPGWVFKEYNGAHRQSENGRLDRLIAFPAQLSSADRVIVDRHTSWPTSRVVADQRTVGVIMPLAPDSFQTVVRLASKTRSELLKVDILAKGDAVLDRLGIPEQPLVNRLEVCLSLVTTAALLERHGIVYLDWSYANAFWSPRDHTAYVIDMDGCSFGARPLIECPGWEDPLVRIGSLGGNPVDRYRVALLVGRCLTNERTAANVPAALGRLARDVPALASVHRVVSEALLARSADDRPRIAVLAAALLYAAGTMGIRVPAGPGPVVSWRPIQRRTPPPPLPAPPPAPPRPVPDKPPPSPAPWTKPAPPMPPDPGLSTAARVGLVAAGALLFVIFLLVIVAFI